jgi:hypothetical protein
MSVQLTADVIDAGNILAAGAKCEVEKVRGSDGRYGGELDFLGPQNRNGPL